MHFIPNFILLTGGLWLMAHSNSESEKWSWPASGKDREKEASDRKDIYFESINGSGERNGRIRVPTSYHDNRYGDRRPYSQQYQVKESTTNRPKPLSDEFSNEFTASGEGYGGNNRYPPLNFPNRFGSPTSQQNDFSPFGYQQHGGAGGAYPQFGPGGYPGGQHYPIGGNVAGYPGQFPIHGGNPHGYPQHNNLANGLLVGPGGPTGIIGRPRYPHFQGGYPGGPGGYPHFGGGYPQQPYGFEGQHNGLGNGLFNPALGGGYGGIDPYNQQYPFNPQFGGGPYGPQYDTQGKNSAVKNKVEKSAK